ncbi:hypothetical protein D3C83_39210 [compost metagenome]
MSSAWTSVSLNCFIRSCFGSSELRMTLMTLSMFNRTMTRPSRMWMRFSTCPSRNFERRVTVLRRNCTHSPTSSAMFLRVGRPSSPSATRLIGKFSSMLVCVSRKRMNSSGS